MKYPAHIRQDSGSIQTVSEHCRNTAKLAQNALRSANLGECAYLAGLVHDCGKYTEAFRSYITNDTAAQGSVIHSFQGCRMLLEHFHQDGAPRYEDITCELLSYAAGAHHGLFDCVDDTKCSGFLHRRTAETDYEEARDRFLRECAPWSELERWFAASNEELVPILERINQLAESNEELSFYLGLLARLLLSAVIEGDRHDTAHFMNDTPLTDETLAERALWERLLRHMEGKLANFPQDTAIQQARSRFSLQCRRAAEGEGGIYRLHLPTGGGKTLASLRFALAHAARWGKQRILFTAPLLTILEQNAAVLRDFIGDDSVVLEHHSNVVQTESGEKLDERELLTENWSAPVIITSMVQLLNTLFSGKTTSIRRFHALCNSVIVIDEVQTVPEKLLTLFNLAVNFLSEVCGATFVLCSATQPCLEKADHPLRKNAVEMVPYDVALWEVFRRTSIVDVGGRTLAEIPSFVREKRSGSVLVICNKKSESEYLFRELSCGEEVCFHLSAAMCMAHRQQVLRKIEDALTECRSGGKKVIVVSTQVIEAGVDISFDCVIRLQAGLDSVVQSAGRCNRHGESVEPMPVYLLSCTDEKLGRLPEIQRAKTASETLLADYRSHPQRYGCDLSSDAAVERYYQALYQEMPKGYQDFALREGGTLFDLMAENHTYADEECKSGEAYFMRQAFRKAGRLFRVFDDEAESVLVPYGKGRTLIQELCAMGDAAPAWQMQEWLRQARPYTVSLYHYQKEQLGDAVTTQNGIWLLREGFYSEETGLQTQSSSLDFWEV